MDFSFAACPCLTLISPPVIRLPRICSTGGFSDGPGATKRDLMDYLDAVSDRILPGLVDRPLTVLRVLRGRAPFMQKNVPKYTPEFVRTVAIWAEASKRGVHYALCDDRRTLLWLANQRAIEYHPTLGLAEHVYRPTHLVLDLDPPGAEHVDQRVDVLAARDAAEQHDLGVGAQLRVDLDGVGAQRRDEHFALDLDRSHRAKVLHTDRGLGRMEAETGRHHERARGPG